MNVPSKCIVSISTSFDIIRSVANNIAVSFPSLIVSLWLLEKDESIRSSTNSSGDVGSLGSSTLRLLHIELSSFLNVREDAPGALRHSLLKISLKPSVDNSEARFILFARTILSDMYSEREWLCTFVTSNRDDVAVIFAKPGQLHRFARVHRRYILPFDSRFLVYLYPSER